MSGSELQLKENQAALNNSVIVPKIKKAALPVDRPTTSSLKKKQEAIVLESRPKSSSPKRKHSEGTSKVGTKQKKRIEDYINDEFESLSRQNSTEDATAVVTVLVAEPSISSRENFVIKPKTLADYSKVENYLEDRDFEDYDPAYDSTFQSGQTTVFQAAEASSLLKASNRQINTVKKSYSSEDFESYEDNNFDNEMEIEYSPKIVARAKSVVPSVASAKHIKPPIPASNYIENTVDNIPIISQNSNTSRVRPSSAFKPSPVESYTRQSEPSIVPLLDNLPDKKVEWQDDSIEFDDFKGQDTVRLDLETGSWVPIESTETYKEDFEDFEDVDTAEGSIEPSIPKTKTQISLRFTPFIKLLDIAPIILDASEPSLDVLFDNARRRNLLNLNSKDLEVFVAAKANMLEHEIGVLKANSNDSLAPEKKTNRKKTGTKNKFFLPFSDGMEELFSDIKLFNGRKLVDFSVSSANPSLLYAAFTASGIQNNKDPLASKGLIAAFTSCDDKQSITLHKLLVSPDPTITCLGSSSRRFVAAGTENAGIWLWDLNNPRMQSSCFEYIDKVTLDSDKGTRAPIPVSFLGKPDPKAENHISVPVIAPTFSSFKSGFQQETHLDSIDSISFVEIQQRKAVKPLLNVVSVDKSGTVCFWDISENAHLLATVEAKTEQRVAFDSLVSLRLKWLVQLFQEQQHIAPGSCNFDPGKSWQLVQAFFHPYLLFMPLIYVSTNAGFTLHDVFHQRAIKSICAGALPFRVCSKFELPLSLPAQVTAFSASPYAPEFFLAGLSSGIIALYSITSSVPLLFWQVDTASAIAQIEWSPQRPAVFFCLTESGKFVIYDLLVSRATPQIMQALNNYREQIGMLVRFTLKLPIEHDSQQHIQPNLCRKMSVSEMKLKSKLASKVNTLLLSFSTGVIEAHQLEEQWVQFEPNEENFFNQFNV